MEDKKGAADEPITHVDIPDEQGADGANEGNESAPAVEKPTLSDLADSGLSKDEIAIAKKQGLVKGEADGDKSDGGDGDSNKSGVDKSADGSAKKDGEDNAKKEKEEKEERNRVLTKGKSPEKIISEIGEKGALSREQEQVLLASLTQNGQAMYWAQKKERQKRQKAESAMADVETKKQKEIDDLRAELAEAKKARKAGDDPLDLENPEAEEEVDPEKKPLTKADLDKIEADKKAKADKEAEVLEERKREISDALNFQQQEAVERYGKEEVESSLSFTKELIGRANDGQLDELFPDARQRSKILRKVTDLIRAFATADRFEDGDFNAADMSIELAKEHPKYKPATKSSKSNASGKKNGETDADGNPEDADRALKNANRRGSSATLNGGNSRRVLLEELTPEQAVKVPMKNWNKLPASKREELLSQ